MEKPHCFDDYWRRGYGKTLLKNTANNNYKYGKTVRIGGYKRRITGNRKKFELGELVEIGDGRKGNIVDFYEHDRVFFYRIVWYGHPKHTHSWHESKVIRRS